MTEKTIQAIKAEYSRKGVELQNRRHARVDELTSLRQPTGDVYFLDRLNAAQKHQVLLEQKAELAEEDRRRLQAEYRAAHDAYARDVAERTAQLRERLFAVQGAEDAGLIAQVTLADEAELSSLLDAASHSDNRALAKVVFAVADQRGLGDVMARYFDQVDGEAQSLYHEFNQAPTLETVAKQRDDVDRLIAPASAEQLAGSPPVYS